MSKHGKPLWKVIAEPTNDFKANTSIKKKEVNKLRTYTVIAPEMEVTARGTRSNELNVKNVCIEKGFNVIGAIFMGYTKSIPKGTIDISQIPVEDETPKRKFEKKPYNKRR